MPERKIGPKQQRLRELAKEKRVAANKKLIDKKAELKTRAKAGLADLKVRAKSKIKQRVQQRIAERRGK